MRRQGPMSAYDIMFTVYIFNRRLVKYVLVSMIRHRSDYLTYGCYFVNLIVNMSCDANLVL